MLVESLLPFSDAPPYTIRTMAPDEGGVLEQLDWEAFETYRLRHTKEGHPLRHRTSANMDAALHRPYSGVVIEWPPGKVAGYCFTHVWGSLGWLGTLGVAPKNQGFGLGYAVTAAGIALLREAGCTTIALETMPDSGKNLGLYTRLGLEGRDLTVLCQGIPDLATSVRFDLWQGGSSTLEAIAGQIVPGLNPAPAAQWLLDEDAGQTLIWWDDGHPAAFASLRTGSRREGSYHLYLVVEAAACTPRAAVHWPRYLSEIQWYARSLRKSGVVLPVNMRQPALLRAALSAGLKIVQTRARLGVGDDLGASDDVLMLTLAM
ncbi:MAG TPA: GNAT family N-acetyltransferase [Aggregatilinea sp.]|uniref:GNAT family N-acetyltransferase n=1 Tax=Aggregatilinea sp. TaxID=2806333 RepID=UPI002C8D31AD|nr:GNAT family N-acetyltransferase [Aggregatilinea sp.]HML22309.1 GNAT family N-acetyltransferase [Aggregatilinea sp.]